VLGIVALGLVLISSGPARATRPTGAMRPTGAALTRLGPRPSLPPDATVLGRLPGTTRLHLTVALAPRAPRALAVYAQAVSNPGSSSYHRYLTPRRFAQRFGAGDVQIAIVRRALRARGLAPGAASAGHLSIPVTATADQIQRGLSVSLLRLSLPGRRTAVTASAAPALDPGAVRLVQAIVGLSSVSAPRPLLIRPRPGALARRDPIARAHVARPVVTRQPLVPGRRPVAGGPQPCSAARATASLENAHTADQIASAYGFPGLYRAGDLGAGVSVAIYELEPNHPSDIAAYQSCYGTHASIAYVRVDGGAGGGPGSGEAALDVENLIGMAPDAHVLVYQGPNSSSGAPGSGPYDTFSAIVNQDRARVVSVSWGQCEANLAPGDAQAENTLFAEAAIQGQSIVAAAGDGGAEDCSSTGGPGQSQAAVDDPSSQPFVTGVGGTTLESLGPPVIESAWNAGGTTPAGPVTPGAGGGGISDVWTMPADQLDAAPGLDLLGAGLTGPQCGHPGAYCREVPDVSADADPRTGYTIFFNGDGSDPGQPAGWQTFGGTSAAAPVWSALLTLADASNACAGSPVGFADPALYRAAGTAYAADFHDVRTGDNDFTHTNAGHYGAGVGYDEATGLGTPNAAALAAELCAESVSLADPGPRRSAAGTEVSLALHAHDVPGGMPEFQATGLPPGLSVGRDSGRIVGRPRRTGTFSVRATVSDSAGSAATVAFQWTIGGAPQISDVTLAGRPAGRPQLSFTVTAGSDAPALTQLTVTLPGDLWLASAAATQLTGPGARHPGFGAYLSHGALEIKLGRPLASVQITLTYPQLRSAGPGILLAHGRRGQGSPLTVRIRDAGAGTAALYGQVRSPWSG